MSAIETSWSFTEKTILPMCLLGHQTKPTLNLRDWEDAMRQRLKCLLPEAVQQFMHDVADELRSIPVHSFDINRKEREVVLEWLERKWLF